MFDPATLQRLRRESQKTRKAQGLTQKELEAITGVSQSQISYIENGEGPLGEGKIRQLRQLCEKLGVEIPDTAGASQQPVKSAIAFCPDPWCPGAVIRTIPQHIRIKPTFVKMESEGTSNCEICGEVLVRECEQCERPVQVGICCPKCGRDYVDVPDRWQGLDTDQLREIDRSNRDFSNELSKDRARFG